VTTLLFAIREAAVWIYSVTDLSVPFFATLCLNKLWNTPLKHPFGINL